MSSRWSGLVRPRPPLLLGLLLALVPFLQDPGRLTFDTKLDLSVDPIGFLSRALHLWDPQGGLGQLQNQAFGYLFPMGPFFAAGQVLDVPSWITQRAWEALLLVLAAEGARRLARELVGASTSMALVAGALYALAPRMLTVLGPISAEALPAALLPWALLPLVRHGDTDPRRAALLSGSVVLGMGAANATLTVAVLPALFLWVVTRSQGRVRLLGWQAVGVLLAVGWWLVPLLVMGKYSPPFLDWVESAADTTKPVGVLPALRGVDHWVAYVPVGGGPVWPAGHALVASSALVLATGLVAAIGLAGLARRQLPERRFLGAIALVGLLLLVLGHTGPGTGPFAGSVQGWLDGALAPLRNIHKFDPLLRLPLVLAAAHLLSHQRVRAPAGLVVRGAAVVLALVIGAPLAHADFRPGPAFDGVPSWWRAAATDVGAHGIGRTLVVPGSGFTQYTWGRTVDEPLQSLASGPWAVRGQVPLGGAGSTRFMDSVEAVLATGRGSAALADLLARNGIGQLIVRNDLDRRYADTLSPVVVHAALDGSSGLTRVASYGPDVTTTGAEQEIGGTASYPSVEIYHVDRDVPQVRLLDAARAVQVAGGPEAVLPLLEAGVLTAGDAAVLVGDAAAPEPRAAVTDTLRRRERAFTTVHQALGPTLSAAEGFQRTRRVHDLLTFDPSHHQTVAVYDGVDAVRASSSASDAAAPGVASPGALPWAAVDGNPYTAWRSVSFDGPVGQWWEVRFAQPRDVTGLKVRFVSSDLVGPAVTQVEVRTDRGLVVQPATDAALSTPTGTTRTLRLTVKAVRGNVRTGNVGVSDVTVPGLAPARALQIPDDITATVSPTVVLGLDPAPVPTCVTAGDTTSCRGAALGLEGDPDGLTRVVRLNQGRVFAVSGTVLPTQSQDVLALLNPISPTVTVTASSTLGNSPAVRPAAAIDGDPRTSWVASPFDAAPVLHVRWPSARQLTSIRVTTGDSSGVAVPLRVHLTTPHGTRDLLLGPDGTAQFPVLGTDRVDVSFPELARSLAVDPTAPPAANIPVAVSELSFPSAHDRPYLPTAAQPTGAPCGFGPQIRVDDTVIETKVSGTVQDLLRSRPLRMEACGTASKGLTLTTGSHRIQVLQSARFSGSSLVLRPVTTDVIGSGDRTLDVVTWTAAHRTVNVGAGGAALLVVPENANVGWSATVNGRQLVARTVDGWQQGWLLPAGAAGTVRLDFQPDSPYRAGLFLGGLGALLLLVLSAVAVLRPDVRVPRPQPPVRMPSSLRAVGAVGVAALLAGWWGVALVGLCGLLVMRARGREWLPAGGVLAATLVTAGKAAEVGQTVQLLALAAVLAVLVTFVAT